ncbi:MAG TPA: winged helix DNA-binding protein [Stellaceae bacterium]|nr:winged helix DNA-binding protein [Stellaceae bacterium]
MILDLDEHVPFLLYRVASKLMTEANAEYKALGVNTMCSRILMVLLRDTTAKVGDLCEATSTDQSTVSHTLIKLSRMGLISKRRQLQDNRTVRVTLTPKGTEIARRCTDIAVRYEELVRRGLSHEQIETLKTTLRQLFENLAEFEMSTATAD